MRPTTSLLVSLVSLLGVTRAFAQGQVPPQPYPQPAPQPVAQPMAPQPMAPQPTYAPPPAAPQPDKVLPVEDANAMASDHDQIVNHMGLEAITLTGTAVGFDKGGSPCNPTGSLGKVPMHAAGLRMWTSRNFAFNADLAFALGGGSCNAAGMTKTNNTYFGVGPAGGVSFLLGLWKHVAVSASPNASFVFFTPGGASAKSSFALDLRGVLEAEMHLGWFGLPNMSLAVNTGLDITMWSTSDTASEWAIGFLGPSGWLSSLTSAAVRFYM